MLKAAILLFSILLFFGGSLQRVSAADECFTNVKLFSEQLFTFAPLLQIGHLAWASVDEETRRIMLQICNRNAMFAWIIFTGLDHASNRDIMNVRTTPSAWVRGTDPSSSVANLNTALNNDNSEVAFVKIGNGVSEHFFVVQKRLETGVRSIRLYQGWVEKYTVKEWLQTDDLPNNVPLNTGRATYGRGRWVPLATFITALTAIETAENAGPVGPADVWGCTANPAAAICVTHTELFGDIPSYAKNTPFTIYFKTRAYADTGDASCTSYEPALVTYITEWNTALNARPHFRQISDMENPKATDAKALVKAKAKKISFRK